MPPVIETSDLSFPDWLFEQDYMVFLSFFGWTLLGLLAWTKPLCDRQKGEALWFWFGYFAFAEAMGDFVRTLSFSDPFFRSFSIEIPLEMLGLGCLIEASVRGPGWLKGRSFPPAIAIACGLLGFAIEVGSLLYSLVVAFLVSTVACLWFAWRLREMAIDKDRYELIVVAAGVVLLIPAWVLHPDHIAFLRNETLVAYSEFPFYGFLLLFLRILSAWLALGGFWFYRLRARMDDVADPAREKLRTRGFRVMPLAVALIMLASYMVTTWNGRREKDRIEEDLLSRSQTAALALQMESDRETLLSAAGERSSIAESLRQLREIGSEVDRVYVWKDDQLDSIGGQNDPYGFAGSVVAGAMDLLDGEDGYQSGNPFVFGPIRMGSNLRINVSSPILDTETERVLAWLGIDLRADEWMKNISLARLQTITIAGLVLALIIFFIYYQIENESETDLALAKERAEAADRAKGEFLAVMSHEIRTPLQSVLGYSNLLKNTRLDAKQMSCLDTIQSEGKILLRIVQDILDFSNLRKASPELKEDSVHLKSLIEETYRTIQPMAEKKGLVAELEIDPALPAIIRTDGVRLRQALLNLYGNSVKYTETGVVRLAVGPNLAKRSPGAVEFRISDTGVGIKPEDLDRLFEPFIQLAHDITSPREGAGLGLAIVKRIVELMGGRIYVESKFGRGTRFTVNFDFHVEQLEESSSEESRQVRVLRSEVSKRLGHLYPLKVLVADDNPMVRRLITLYLEAMGYSPDQVDDGKPVSERGGAYDLIISDLRMPGLDGPGAAKIVRKKSGIADQPWIIGVSATLAEKEIERAMDAGINDFLGKPFFESDLEAKIRAIPWLVESSASEDSEEAVESAIDSSFVSGGMGFFSDELIDQAVDETRSLCSEMLEAAKRSDYAFVRNKAHYLSNTAMALGIESLYTDSKRLQKAAEEQSVDCPVLISRLQENFASWEESR
jgi:signal transduction histidine kinase/CheY-like chemotaxis protein